MKRLSWTILAFSITFAVLFIVPSFLSQRFSLYPLMNVGEVTDIVTPLILIPLYWLLYQVDTTKTPALGESALFMVLAALWVEGQGMHLSANSIGHLLRDMNNTDAYRLTNFYDESLSHYIWHIGLVGLSALLVFRQWRYAFMNERGALALESLAGLFYGLTYFLIVIEADTAPLGVPFAVLVVLFGLVWGRKRLRQQPLLAFFVVAYLLATILFAVWAILWGGLPEFSEVGLVD